MDTRKKKLLLVSLIVSSFKSEILNKFRVLSMMLNYKTKWSFYILRDVTIDGVGARKCRATLLVK